MFHFMGDEGTQSAAEWNLIHGHLPLLGPSLSIGNMHLGPFFYYLMAVPLWLAGGSPVGPTVTVGLFGVGTVALLFLYLRAPLGDWPALGASAVMAVSFLMVEYSRRPWNPTPTPFFTLLFLWSLVLWKRQSDRYAILTAGSLAVLLQLQPVNVFLVLLFAVFLIAARPARPGWAVIGIACLVFLVISSPLIIYDLSHHLANTRAWLDVVIGGKSHAAGRSASSPRLLFNLFNRAFEPRIVAVGILIAVVISLAAVYVAFIDNDAIGANWEVLLPLILLGIAAIGFEIYRKEVFEQYMICLFVIPFIFLATFLRLLWADQRIRVLAVIVVLGLVAVGVRDTWTYSFVDPQVTAADAAVTSHDLQPDDVFSHVQAVDRTIERWAAARPFGLTMTSYLNSAAGYEYVLARDGYALRSAASLQYLLIEPASWPRKDWNAPGAVRLASSAARTQTIGIIRLYQDISVRPR
jgi:4-amino-4-deoxy-L-arabinose transferase-like glycosyltransferase